MIAHNKAKQHRPFGAGPSLRSAAVGGVMSMSDSPNQISMTKGYFLLAGGLLVSIIIMMFIDVQIELSKIDPNNPETWPNMGTGIRYFFIPIIFLPLYACLAFLVFICEKFVQKTKYKSWFYQGVGCGMVMSILPMAWLDIPVILGISLPIILAVLSITFVRIKYSNEKNS